MAARDVRVAGMFPRPRPASHIVLRVLDQQLAPEPLIRNGFPVSRKPLGLYPLLDPRLIEGADDVPRVTHDRDSAALVQPPQPFDHRAELYAVPRRVLLAAEELPLVLLPDEDRGPATGASAPTRSVGVEP